MGLDLTSFDNALKELYSDKNVENMVYKDNAFLAMVPKQEDFYGKKMPIPLIYGNPQGRSANFAQAQARGAATSSLVEAFDITRASDYSIATIDNQTLLASESDKGAFMKAATTEIDGALNSLQRSLAVSIYKSGFGEIGRINATVAGTTLTLANPDDITNFEVGQQIVFSDTLGASVLRDSGEALTVTKVDRSAGSMTVSANLNTITGITANDYIFIAGDRQNVASPVPIKLSGLESWIPASAPSATLFFGVDRTQDTTRLSGVRHDGSSQPIEEALIDLAFKIGRESGKPDYCFMNPVKYRELVKSLGSKVQFVDFEVGEIGFRALEIHGPHGTIKVISDFNCPSDKAYMLQMDTWVLASLGKAVRLTDTDGVKMLRQNAADGVEVRVASYSNLACKAPGYNGVVTLA